jgi:hypothetical protein
MLSAISCFGYWVGKGFIKSLRLMAIQEGFDEVGCQQGHVNGLGDIELGLVGSSIFFR